jgi:cytochrome c
MRTILTAVAALFVLAALATPTFAASAEEGMRLFNGERLACVSCHGLMGAGLANANGEAKAPALQGFAQGKSDVAIERAATHSCGDGCSRSDVEALVALLKAM